MLAGSDIERIREKIRESVMIEPFSGCWLWTRGCFSHRSGPQQDRPAIYITREIGQVFAYRAAYEAWKEKIPQGMCVLHRCDTSICVNPGHLFLGTLTDNMRDASAKDRVKSGERHHNAKLKAWQVLEIRACHARGETTFRALADAFGVGYNAVYLAVSGKTWKALKEVA